MPHKTDKANIFVHEMYSKAFKGISEIKEFNDGHAVEGLDRCHTVMLLINELLVNHPAVTKTNNETKLEDACASIMEIYQDIGSIEC